MYTHGLGYTKTNLEIVCRWQRHIQVGKIWIVSVECYILVLVLRLSVGIQKDSEKMLTLGLSRFRIRSVSYSLRRRVEAAWADEEVWTQSPLPVDSQGLPKWVTPASLEYPPSAFNINSFLKKRRAPPSTWQTDKSLEKRWAKGSRRAQGCLGQMQLSLCAASRMWVRHRSVELIK